MSVYDDGNPDWSPHDEEEDEDMETGMPEYNWHYPLPEGHPSRKTMMDMGLIETFNQKVCLICGEINFDISCQGQASEIYEPPIAGYREGNYPIPVPRSKRRINWKEGF